MLETEPLSPVPPGPMPPDEELLALEQELQHWWRQQDQDDEFIAECSAYEQR